MWVFDSTPLIYLAKVERLGEVRHLDGRCLLPGSVYEEVVGRGLDREFADARRVQQRVDSGLLEVRDPVESDLFASLRDVDSLSRADSAVIALAHAVDGTVVMDETAGREIAAVEGVESRGTAYVVLSLARDGHLAPDEARAVVDGMLESGWYCAPNLYAKILRRLESLT